MNPRYLKGTLAVLAGMALNVLGDMLLGVRIELFSGIATFNFSWMVDVFLVPFGVGLAVARIYGARGANGWLASHPSLYVV